MNEHDEGVQRAVLRVRQRLDEDTEKRIDADLVLTDDTLRLVPTPESERIILDHAQEQADQETQSTSRIVRGLKKRAIRKTGYYMFHPEEIGNERFYWRWPLNKIVQEMQYKASLAASEVWLDESGLHVNGANVNDTFEHGEFVDADARVFVERFERAKEAVRQGE